ncbi:MAG: putative accessory gene regulator protein [Pelotomaculum sp. PtaB.Bin013]|uniref:Accessory gene regulator B family protein n=1 Tax=Pelotomaculum isophthalicicum JI TaxID=947010 RepID=A0A9X4H904_9FIRM|nr:accessory gene regulator B family protein [Pelotomaculum isophthalicicum]MDF9409469.1 accessory gene regulator B family protein [Pelotomaculum isophthalicicum JI]OPX85707.1 MAG: putative accessory gene regulator protein [Pelotomaculum sp. PtaB.Bin013]
MIKTLARKIAIVMGAQLKVNRDQVEIFTYGLELIFGTLVQLVLIMSLSLLVDTFITTMLCLIAFASLRFFGGGVHLSTYPLCLVIGVSLLISLGKLATLAVNPVSLTFISALILLMGIYVIFRWVPAGTAKKQIRDESIRQEQRKKAFLVLTVWSVVIVMLITQKMAADAFAVILGILGSLILMTPLGYKAAKVLDSILNIAGKEV